MKRGVKTIIAGCLVLLLGIVAPVPFIIAFVLGHGQETQFKIPGSTEVTLDKPGRYYLWNDFRTVYNGRSYDQSEKIPGGLEIQIRDANNNKLEFMSDTTVSSSVGNNSKKSIGYIEIEHPGKVTIQVTGGGEDRIFSFSQFDIRKLFLSIIGGLSLFTIFAIAGVGLIILGVVKLARGK